MTTDAAPAEAPAKPKRTPAPKAAKLTVPGKPAAVTAGNLGTLATTAAVVGGPAAWVTLAGVGAAGLVVVAARRYRRSSTGRVSSGWAVRMPKVGTGGGRPSAGGRNGRPTGASRAAGAGRAAGSWLGLGRPASRTGATGGRPGGSHARPHGRTGGPPGTGGSKPRGGKSAASTRAGRLARRAARRTARILAPVRRRAWTAVKAAGRLISPRQVWAWGRRLVRRMLGRTDPHPETVPAAPPGPIETEPPTGVKVDRPAGPVVAPTTERIEPMTELTAPEPGGPIFEAARRFRGTCAEVEFKGTLGHRAEAWDLSRAIAELAEGIAARVARCGQDAVDTAYMQLLASIGASISASATAAGRLGPAFDDLHRDKIYRLLHPLVGEEKWDTVANNGG